MLISFTDNGLYCEQGGFHIDPWRPVDAAVTTHAHSDHARAGSRSYLCHRSSRSILRARLGEHSFQTVEWGESVTRNGVRISLHPAGHIIGSSQVRVEYKGEVWVVSGDYKTEDDGISGAFEAVRCHTFVTESTFGLPVYRWKPQTELLDEMRAWVRKNRDEGYSSVFQAYSLGKAQRLVSAFRHDEGRIFAHGAVLNMQSALMADGWDFPRVERMSNEIPEERRRGCVFITPAPVENSRARKMIGPYRTAVCSGWMQVRGNKRRGAADAGFALSDHADWDGLLSAVRATGAERVFATHGFQSAFSRYLQETGIEAHEVQTAFGQEEPEVGEEDTAAGATPSQT